jgi:hypothetical protein
MIRVPQSEVQKLYEVRLVVLMETDAQTNTYCQVELNPAQFKEMSLCLSKQFQRMPELDPTGGMSVYAIKTRDLQVNLPEEIQSTYE